METASWAPSEIVDILRTNSDSPGESKKGGIYSLEADEEEWGWGLKKHQWWLNQSLCCHTWNDRFYETKDNVKENRRAFEAVGTRRSTKKLW